jgi:hypothetical protein
VFDGYAPCAYVADSTRVDILVAKTTDMDCNCKEPMIDLDERTRTARVTGRDSDWSVTIGW